MIKKILLLSALLISSFAHSEDAPIVDWYDLHDQGGGIYYTNFTKDTYKAKVRVDSNALSKLWYCGFDFKIGPNWTWGDTTYEGDNRFLSNIKLFRFWSPSLGGGSENLYIGMMGWEPNMHMIPENIPSENNYRFMSDYKQRMTPNVWHRLEVEFKDSDKDVSNGYVKIWFNNELVLDKSGLLTNKTGQLKRPYIIGFDAVWPTSNDKAPNDFWIKNIFAKMNETRSGDSPVDPTPSPTPTPTPDVYPREGEVINSDMKRLRTPGGWIVYDSRGQISSMIFVPFSDNQWTLEDSN